jgi:hypothetical protein
MWDVGRQGAEGRGEWRYPLLVIRYSGDLSLWGASTTWTISTIYGSLREAPWACRRAYRLFSLPLIRFLLNLELEGSIFSWQTLIGHCTLPEGIGSNGFSDRRILSFVRTVYYLHHGFPTQTERPRCSATRNSSVNRNCTILHAKPSTWLYGRISWVSRNHFSLLPRANVERDSAGGKEISTNRKLVDSLIRKLEN